MHIFKKILTLSVLFSFMFVPKCLSYNSYIWSDNFDSYAVSSPLLDSSSVSSNTSLNLDCGSAILIEQNSRSSFI